MTPDELLAALVARGSIQLVPRSEAERGLYRRAIHALINSALVPAGQMVRHSGRDSGELRIWLAPRPEPVVRPAAIVVAGPADPGDAVIAALLSQSERLRVSTGQQERALALVQALINEARRRGHTVGAGAGEATTFAIGIGPDSFDYVLSEEYERRTVPDTETTPARYAWQRIPETVRSVPSGRLRLELVIGWTHPAWADRKRWRLEDKLAQALTEGESRAAALAADRAQADAARRKRRAEWEAAVPAARARHAQAVNQRRLDEQVEALSKADSIRRYCDRLSGRAATTADPLVRARIEHWAEWARAVADDVDPLRAEDELCLIEPPTPPTEDLDRFMPAGMTVRHPPQ